jgi:hypothetical protein
MGRRTLDLGHSLSLHDLKFLLPIKADTLAWACPPRSSCPLLSLHSGDPLHLHNQVPGATVVTVTGHTVERSAQFVGSAFLT